MRRTVKNDDEEGGDYQRLFFFLKRNLVFGLGKGKKLVERRLGKRRAVDTREQDAWGIRERVLDNEQVSDGLACDMRACAA